MKVYVSGPMTGLPEFNFPAFEQAAESLRAAGYEVVSPRELNPDSGQEWSLYLKRDIVALIECDGIVTLDNWHLSKGARLEVHIALELGLKLMSLERALAVAP